jgi:AraC family transcriptional regulator, transcriptional activator of pobA
LSNTKNIIPAYAEINDFLDGINAPGRSKNPLFYCLRLKANKEIGSVYKPPFRKDFYFIALITNADTTKITYDTTNVSHLNSFLVFQSPGLLYSFSRGVEANGYLIYFKKGCLSFFKPDFDKAFPFFNILQTNFFKLNQQKFNDFSPYFEEVFTAYENATDNQHTIASIKLLALLYQLKDITTAFAQWTDGFSTPQRILFQKFIQLVNHYYVEKRTIEEYAELLFVTPNHLSQYIKEASGKNALSFINDRIMTEAKSLIQFTDYDIAEIAYQLNFSDPANFGKFFKKHSEQTPLEFRKKFQ